MDADGLNIRLSNHRDKLDTDGYSVFSLNTSPFDINEIEELNNIFKGHTVFRGLPSKYAHDLAMDITIATTENGWHITKLISPIDGDKLEKILDVVLRRVLKMIPPGTVNTKRLVKIVFVDDFKEYIENYEETLRREPRDGLRTLETEALFWHQDKFLDANYQFVLFMVTHVQGVQKHFLQLGRVKPELLIYDKEEALKTEHNDQATLIENIPSQVGSGYIIDQNKPIIHRHTGFATFISNFSYTAENLWKNTAHLNLSNFLDRYGELINLPNNVNSSHYQTPRRYKIIIRIEPESSL